MRKQDRGFRPQLEALEDRTLLSATSALGDVFYIDMENHNLTQPSGLTGSPEQLLGNPAAPYLNSLMTPGNPNAAQTSYASNYYNADYNNPAVSIHPSEPNYVWQEGGGNFGVANDDDPYANNGLPSGNNVNLIAGTGNDPANLSALLQAQYGAAGWHSYQEDMQYTGLSVPTSSASGTNGAVNPYNGSTQYNFAVKHDGALFYTATNGGTLSGPGPTGSTNTEAAYYSPLGQLATDLANNTVAMYNLITPDQYNDMHSSLTNGFTYNGVHYTGDQSSIAAGDNFLSQIIPMIEASQAYKNNGAIVIWFDETEGGNTTQYTIPEIVISPLAKGNAYDSTVAYTHSSDLKTLEEVFGVSAPGGGFLGDANTPGTNDLSDMFVAVRAEPVHTQRQGLHRPPTRRLLPEGGPGRVRLDRYSHRDQRRGPDDQPHDHDQLQRLLLLHRVAPRRLFRHGHAPEGSAERLHDPHRNPRRHHARRGPDHWQSGLRLPASRTPPSS